MEPATVYMSQDVVDTFVAIIFATFAVSMTALGALMYTGWRRNRKNGG